MKQFTLFFSMTVVSVLPYYVSLLQVPVAGPIFFGMFIHSSHFLVQTAIAPPGKQISNTFQLEDESDQKRSGIPYFFQSLLGCYFIKGYQTPGSYWRYGSQFVKVTFIVLQSSSPGSNRRYPIKSYRSIFTLRNFVRFLSPDTFTIIVNQSNEQLELELETNIEWANFVVYSCLVLVVFQTTTTLVTLIAPQGALNPPLEGRFKAPSKGGETGRQGVFEELEEIRYVYL
eukprot:TRINITY_DN8338_c0_g1_i1.p2 TRINITY_DN8338_c0_g1~~TRINITY_DN8338_c0_g1_i1.p2  ORF type:complete len:229 (+),score=2.66 TRINITY_DN8338_c0_g1_i1:639-1325(+)